MTRVRLKAHPITQSYELEAAPRQANSKPATSTTPSSKENPAGSPKDSAAREKAGKDVKTESGVN